MRLVIIESPYAPKDVTSPEDYAQKAARNVAYARAAMKDCLRRGEAPYASHLLYTQQGVLDDTVSAERSLGIEAGLAWGKKADATVVYEDLGISGGMMLGIATAKAERRPVEMRRLGADWDK